MIEEIFKTLRQDGKTLASSMDELEKIVKQSIPKEQRHLLPNFAKMRGALKNGDPNAALEVYNKAKATLNKVKSMGEDQFK